MNRNMLKGSNSFPRVAGFRHRGFTLLEILVFLMIAGIPLAVIWNFLISGSKQSVKMQGRAQAIQAVQLTFETIRNDLAQLGGFEVKDGDSSDRAELSGDDDGQETTAASADNGAFTFFRYADYGYEQEDLYSSSPEDTAWLNAERVSYRFNRESHRLERNGRSVGAARFYDAGLNLVGDHVAVTLILCPEELLDRGEEPDESQKTVLSFQVGLPQITTRNVYSAWTDNYFDRAPEGQE